MNIPNSLETLLLKDPPLHGAVELSLADFERWFRFSGLPFFPEYTDHSPDHVSQVLATASSIIPEEAWHQLTPPDAGVLVLGILLHDCAMHLTEDGFVALVRPDSTRPLASAWNDRPWPALWLEFRGEASRFDRRKLNALFGDSEPVHWPDLDPKKFTLRDRLLIGEFIRRHHARLAHEIALYGVPGPGDKPISLKNVDEDYADLAGMVARSHGVPIRSCLDHLHRYDVREYRGVHAVFLMAVVRVADYLQVHSERAPTQVLQVRTLRSPVSQGEWKVHEAVRDIRHTHEDPEALFIDAMPSDVATYLKLKRLLQSIQGEMDASWAVLGEVYGRFDGLSALVLNLRRIRSNLDDDASFAKTVKYVPCKAAFETADADLLRLLIGPLYGDHPEIGIRELMQNALDACRELRDYVAQRPEFGNPEFVDQEADVVVTLSEDDAGSRWLSVSDRGIGMTVEVVRDYFLRAGASYRRSDAWRSLHQDELGKTRVLRSGRFGVGVLAAFLLGNEVHVCTRHVSAPREEGISFHATIDTVEIELLRIDAAIGTTVRVRIEDDNTWKRLTDKGRGAHFWDWYCLAGAPTVIRRTIVGKGSTLLKQRRQLAPAESELPSGWRRITHKDYQDIQWSTSVRFIWCERTAKSMLTRVPRVSWVSTI